MSTEASSPAERYAAFRRGQTGPALADFAAGYPFGLDAFQRTACAALESGRGVLVAAPTGAGKTVVGEFAVFLALREGRKCFYTTPIKALSNQKYNDLVERHGAERVGLLTGDNAVNGDADVGDEAGLAVTRMEKGGEVVWLGERKASPAEMKKARFFAARRAKHEAVNRQRDAAISAGFHHNFGGKIGLRTLDQRGASDDENWRGLKQLADDLVEGGEADAMLSIRDAENKTFDAPAQTVSDALRTMLAWRSLIAKRSWDIKDQVAQAKDDAALEAIDIIAGWP